MRRPFVLLALLLPLLTGAQSGVPLQLPASIWFPEFLDTVKVSQAILAAVSNKKWFIEADTGESIRARLKVRSHTLRIQIDYTTRGIAYEYLDSENLGYAIDDDQRLIHPNANKWLAQLDTEIQLQVQKLYYQREPAVVVPVEPAGPEPPADPISP